VAVAKALSDSARETKILTLRGGVLEGVPISGADVESLAKLPPMDVLRSQVVGVIVAPLTQLLGLLSAPLRDLVGLIDARIVQLGGYEETATPSATVDEAAAEKTNIEETEVAGSVDEAPEAPDVDSEATQSSDDSNETTEEE
jgi:hypothetical protein